MIREFRLTPADRDRFRSHVSVELSGCWKWLGPLKQTPIGPYANCHYQGRQTAAHRVAWLLFRGPIPDGFQIDHLCRNTRCVNPDHLEPVTQRENILRGTAPAAINARKTHCIRGHEFTPENTLHYAGHRACRACRKMRYALARMVAS